MKRYTFNDFNHQFPTDDLCLDWLFHRFYPNGRLVCKSCKKETLHHRVQSRPSYSCDECGHHVHPTAGTIFHKSSTSLRLWFYAIYLISSTRMGISAKQLERELGVTYKTAWRMMKQIRSMMGDDKMDKLDGIVEIDETYVGGRVKGHYRQNNNKTPLMGMVERGGRVRTKVVKSDGGRDLLPHVRDNISKDATVMSDQLMAYKALPAMGYDHRSVNHQREWAVGHTHTNTIEGFWSIFKAGTRGVYRKVGKQYLQSYANEYAFRYSHRNSNVPMFQLLLERI
ncbi:MAG: IS1595 family transposase [Candidatus Saccharimonadales bacterium]